MKFFIKYSSILIVMLLALYGCNNESTSPAIKIAKSPGAKKIVNELKAPEPEVAIEETSQQEGYIYKRRDRRDPFAPLIVPTKIQKKDESKAGTLEGYDISEFRLSAIAKKGSQYFALLVTSDNRSFTVYKGTIIGLNKGRVEAITSYKIELVEYSKDYKGNLRPRQIILEFHEGEVE